MYGYYCPVEKQPKKRVIAASVPQSREQCAFTQGIAGQARNDAPCFVLFQTPQ